MYDSCDYLLVDRKQVEVIIKTLRVSELSFGIPFPEYSDDAESSYDRFKFRVNFYHQLGEECPPLIISYELHQQLTNMEWRQLVCLPIIRIYAYAGMIWSDSGFSEYISLVKSIQPPPQYILSTFETGRITPNKFRLMKDLQISEGKHSFNLVLQNFSSH